MFEILSGGLQTTIQDLGRLGYQAKGIPPSGAFDSFSFRMGNLLVGNDVGGPYLIHDRQVEAGLEVLWSGLKLRVMKETVIAVTGGDLSPTLNSQPLPMWKAVRVREGDLIFFNTAKNGCRAYLAVAGGIQVPLFLGSRSTYVKGAIGGLEGRPLSKGDILMTGEPRVPLAQLESRTVRTEVLPKYSSRWEVRVVLGPQDYLFKDESVELFLMAEWRVSPKVDRIGYRYSGPRLGFKPMPEYLTKVVGKDPSHIVDDPNPIGGIQVPGGIEPIVICVDGITLGGYSKIATVISTDIPLIGQSKPGDITTFKAVTVDEAIEALSETETKLGEHNILK